ncbi:hypothetical protein ABIE65_001948 [Constrictibacter sp. MBR-5]|jgi:hypothetical protein|uniref:hypothetical protein n=1 Tax=Constrictibacter sp. MBR-5 TaxID=3156467 RepID=UPI003395D96F
MDPLIVTIVMRSIERLVVVGGACIAIWCGYRLFLAMPSRERGAGKLELPGGVSIHVSRVGPGVFFTLFGAAILGLSLHYGIAYSGPQGPFPESANGNGERVAAARGVSYSGIGAGSVPTTAAGPPIADPARVAAMQVAAERLARAAGALDPALDAFTRGDIERALRTARVELLLSVWNERDWGPADAFRLWLAQGEPEPPPPAVAAGVAVYRAGQPP